MTDKVAGPDESELSEVIGLVPERAALPNRWRVVCTPGAEPYFERHAEGAWAQRERVDAEIAAAVAAERERWRSAVLEMRGRLLWLDQRADTRDIDALLDAQRSI